MLLMVLCAVGRRAATQGQGQSSDKGAMGRSDGSSITVHMHWNGGLAFLIVLLKAPAFY